MYLNVTVLCVVIVNIVSKTANPPLPDSTLQTLTNLALNQSAQQYDTENPAGK